jgi:hypothetical protein
MGQGDEAVNWAGSLSHKGVEEATAEGGSGYDQRGIGSGNDQGYDWQNRRPSTL